MQLLRPHMRPHLWALIAVVFLGGLSALLQKAGLLLLVPTWELFFPGEGSSEALSGFWKTVVDWFMQSPEQVTDPDQRMRLLMRGAGLIAVLAVVAAVLQYLFVLLLRLTALRMIVSLRLRVARHLMGLSLRYHGQRNLGDVLSRVSSDVTTSLSVVNVALRDLIQEPLSALSALVIAAVISWKATLVVVVGLPLLAVPIIILMRRVRKTSKRSSTQLGASLQALTQMFSGIRTVKAFRAEERELEKYRQTNDDYLRLTMKMVRAIALSRGWTILYSHAGLALMLLVVGWLAIRFDAIPTGGAMLTFFMLVSGVYTSIKKTSQTLTKVGEAAGAGDRLLDLLSETPDVVELRGARVVEGLGAGIRFEGVDFAYPEGKGPAIEGLDLHIQPGETLALVGQSGAGKSTLVDLLARFFDPTRGRVTVDGTDLREVSLDSWNAQYSMVTQQPFLFHDTIAENIRYGRPAATLEEVEAAARAAHVDEFVNELPQGYETNVADEGSRLSGGQRQRITIARAILHGGPLLLLDEATSSLDSESENVVQSALEALLQDHTAVVVAHRLSTIRKADRIAVLDEGRLVELGTHDELLEAGGAYSRLYAAQFAGAS